MISSARYHRRQLSPEGADWPATEVADYHSLIDDPRHRIALRHLPGMSGEAGKAIIELLRLRVLPRLGRDEIAEELDSSPLRFPFHYLDILRSAAHIQTIVKDAIKP